MDRCGLQLSTVWVSDFIHHKFQTVSIWIQGLYTYNKRTCNQICAGLFIQHVFFHPTRIYSLVWRMSVGCITWRRADHVGSNHYICIVTSCGRGGVGTPPLPQLFLSPASLRGVALRGREHEGEPGGDKEERWHKNRLGRWGGTCERSQQIKYHEV